MKNLLVLLAMSTCVLAQQTADQRWIEAQEQKRKSKLLEERLDKLERDQAAQSGKERLAEQRRLLALPLDKDLMASYQQYLQQMEGVAFNSNQGREAAKLKARIQIARQQEVRNNAAGSVKTAGPTSGP